MQYLHNATPPERFGFKVPYSVHAVSVVLLDLQYARKLRADRGIVWSNDYEVPIWFV